MAREGDIVVTESGLKWVVLELIGNAHGGQDARLIRKSDDSRSTGLLKDAAGLTVVESEPFQEGDRVTVNGLAGSYLETQNGFARVLLDARTMTTETGLSIGLDAAIASMSIALLVLENRAL
ncbi:MULTISPECIES: hypothetical protein [unclassified Mesorhizobium]|uniref:hypothetical protein n=1 Tax=unclassified Mesorhizobium TaxID=325217 RepID=UPI000FD9AC18|nr:MULTISPECIES: hypothetical protein [unclassified Mesorhizobium]TGQ08706.1 hypothetical protein EN862_020875 [Mesorhizobium sp. M2E.F.Ca.ET.219.01.1.1]TGT69241.1 hypothetical protein EN809_023155 [Mesorhizobium sp. M2E.F.Ca.ET.166.01.1.1]TGW01573.1 hypothetical protein EN797_014650 [Mesorhizobium sp. M2E.F.Ca.ET.154.01.1.1]